MPPNLSARVVSFGLLLQLIFTAQALPAFAEEEDFTIVPGERIGVVKLGMNPEEVKVKMGNHDGAYVLPNGINVEYAIWKETDKITYTIKVFYDKQWRLIQVSEAAPKAITADDISIASSFSDV